MSTSIARTVRLVIQAVIFGLSLSVLGLVIEAFIQLSKSRTRTQADIPGGQLHTKAIVGVGIALLIISIFASSFTIPQSVYIMRHKLPLRFRQFFPNKFAIKSMTIVAVIMTAINIAQTCITATGKGHVTSSVLSDSFVQALLAFSEESLEYKDNHIVVDYTILAWIVWLFLLIGITVEIFEDASDPEVELQTPQGTLQKTLT